MQIPSDFLREARRLFGRLRHTRGRAPLFAHVLASFDIHGITLAVSDGDHWLETFRRSLPEPGGPQAFLIPPSALAEACRADKGSPVSLSPCGSYSRRGLRVATRCGGARIESVHPTEAVEAFPPCPVVAGSFTLVPARTMESLAVVAACASTNEDHGILNGVCFESADGGSLIAADGRRFARVPAIVPPCGFVLPKVAVRVLAHPDFSGYENEVTLPDRKDDPHVMFRAWDHLLIARRRQGRYPVLPPLAPQGLTERATLAAGRRAAVVAWLRSLPDTRTPVHLDWGKGGRGHLTLTRREAAAPTSVMQVPVTVRGDPPTVALHPRHLADALEIGCSLHLHLRDRFAPVLCHDPGGGSCLLMPLREMDRSGEANAPPRPGKTGEAA